MQEIVHIVDFIEGRDLNRPLAEAILALPPNGFEKCSHFFHGRYENIYVAADKLPGLPAVLDAALGQSAEILKQTISSLKFGFWLNIMHKGDVTTLHSHDDDDELLSAVYYIQAPAESGRFRLHGGDEIKEIEPVAGRFIFFDPALPHEVSEHHNEIPRISIGMNVGVID